MNIKCITANIENLLSSKIILIFESFYFPIFFNIDEKDEKDDIIIQSLYVLFLFCVMYCRSYLTPL